jgi:hypothetical protein
VTAQVNMRTVLRAVHDLRDRGAPAPTADELAEHLRTTVAVVKPMLVELKARRILRDHRHGERREWGRW